MIFFSVFLWNYRSKNICSFLDIWSQETLHCRGCPCTPIFRSLRTCFLFQICLFFHELMKFPQQSMIQMMNPSHRLLTQSSSNLIVCFCYFAIFWVVNLNWLFSLTPVHKDDISREQLKELLYHEIMTFQPAPITS